MALESDIRALAEPILADRGLELVDVVLRGPAGRRLVRLDIDRAGAEGVGIDDCQQASRAIGEALDGSELFANAYVLEVSSPGVDRPIRSADDFRRNTGRNVVVTARDADGVERSHRGTLLGCTDGVIRIENAGETRRIPLEGVLQARQDVSL